MRITLRGIAVSAMSMAMVAGFSIGVAGPADADTPTVVQLTEAIREGVKPPTKAAPPTADQRIAPTATAGPVAVAPGTRSVASDTVGYGPSQTSFPPAFAYSITNPQAAPQGANNYACKPKAGQRPIVLVHGTFANAYDAYAYISPELTKAGYCTYTFNYGRAALTDGGGVGALIPGVNGIGDIPTSAGQLAAFVDRVLAKTGASKVDLVGHSQGGVMARQYLKSNGGAAKTQKLITLGATNHGTTLSGIASLGRAINNNGIDVLGFAQLAVGVAGIQQVVGSDFITAVNAGGDTVPGVDYTVIRTTNDAVSTPSEATFLTAGPGATVRNITVQDGCTAENPDHISLTYSPRVVSLVEQALDPATALVCGTG